MRWRGLGGRGEEEARSAQPTSASGGGFARKAETGENEVNPNVWRAEYAKILTVPKKERLVLAATNDPFNCGTPAQVEAAKWFAGVYERLEYRGIHLRRFHYRAYDAGVVTVSGEEY